MPQLGGSGAATSPRPCLTSANATRLRTRLATRLDEDEEN